MQQLDTLKQSTATLLQELPPAMARGQSSSLATKLKGALSDTSARKPTEDKQECHDLCKGSDFQSASKTTSAVLKCCEPHFISGACRLLYNLLLAFPEVVGAQLYNHGFIKGLIGYVHFWQE